MNITNERPERNVTPLSIAGALSNGTRLAALDHAEAVAGGGVVVDKAPENEKVKEEAVTWMSLPHKKQLAVLTMARFSEPLVQTSLQVS